jgi:hypothetical protein
MVIRGLAERIGVGWDGGSFADREDLRASVESSARGPGLGGRDVELGLETSSSPFDTMPVLAVTDAHDLIVHNDRDVPPTVAADMHIDAAGSSVGVLVT